MITVFGDSPLALAVAERASRQAPTTVASAHPVTGPFLWRRVDTTSGKGVVAALRGATRVVAVSDGPMPWDGLFAMWAQNTAARGVVVVPLGHDAPVALTKLRFLSRVHVGPTWGPEHPLVQAWARQIGAGKRVWVTDPGSVRPVATADAVSYILEAASRRGATWSVAGAEKAKLADLAAQIAQDLGAPLRLRHVPARAAAWAAGVSPALWTRWTGAPVTPSVTDGWTPSHVHGRGGWLGDPAPWR